MRHVLGEKNIPVIALKGPHLAYAYYENPEERKYDDLDLLVPGKRFHEAVKLLLQAGYKPAKWDFKRLANINAKYNWGFLSPFGIMVELHRDFCDYRRHRPDLPGIFARAVEFNYGETVALGLAPGDLLLQLCLHAGKSFFITIEKKHIRDIFLVIGKSEIDWEDFCAKAKAWGIKNVCWLALRAALLQHDAKVPENVIQQLSPGYSRQRWLERRLDPGKFPLYRFPDHKLRRSQLGLLFALIDKKRHWVVFCFHYIRLFIADLVLRVPVFRNFYLKHHLVGKVICKR